MEENDDYNMQATGSQKSGRSVKETFRSGTPDEVRDKVKEAVEKGVAAVAGALKGFADRTEESKVADTTRNAIHQAGETARSAISSVTEETRGSQEPLREAGQKLRDTARDLKSSAASQFEETRGALSGGQGSATAAAGAGTEFPDISNTPMAQSDKKLQGKDLTEDIE